MKTNILFSIPGTVVLTGLLFATQSLASSSSTSSPWSWPESSYYDEKSDESAAKPRAQQSLYRRPAPPKAEPRPFSTESHNVSLAVGQVLLLGNLSEGHDDNLGWQAEYVRSVSENFGFNARFGHSEHSDALSLTNLLAGIRLNTRWYQRMIPSITMGLGFYRIDEQITQTFRAAPVLFGMYLAPGLDLEISERLFFGTKITLNNTFGTSVTDKSGSTYRMGGIYTNFLAHAGMVF